MNKNLKKKESQAIHQMEGALTKSNRLSKAEVKPITDPKPVTLLPESDAEKDKQKPFYKKVEFFISVAALLISCTTAYFSFLNSPLSTFTTPRIEYESGLVSGVSADPKEGGGKRTVMVGIIENNSNAPAEDVLVTLVRLEKGRPEITFSFGVEHNIVEETDLTTIIKFPHFPPRYRCTILTEASSEPSLTAGENGSKHLSFPCIISVTYRNGVAIPRNDPCNFRGFQQK